MATRANSTPASTSRRQPPADTAALADLLPAPKSKPRRRVKDARPAATPPATTLEKGAAAALRMGAAEAVLTIDALWQKHHALVDAEDAARRAGLIAEAIVHRNNYDRVFKQISAVEELGASSIPTTALDATAHLLLLREALEYLGGEHLKPAGERKLSFILAHMVWSLKVLSEAHGLPLARMAGTYFNTDEQRIIRGEVSA